MAGEDDRRFTSSAGPAEAVHVEAVSEVDKCQGETSVVALDEDQQAIADLVRRIGLGATARLLGSSREPVLRFSSGLPVRTGTETMLRLRLALARGSPPSPRDAAAAVMPGQPKKASR